MRNMFGHPQILPGERQRKEKTHMASEDTTEEFS
jgi:hypothetical protein